MKFKTKLSLSLFWSNLLVFTLTILAAGALLSPLFLWAAYRARQGSKCLRYGYREANVGIIRPTYCVRRVNQTDEVRALSELSNAK